MSPAQQNIDIARRFNDRWGERDWDGVLDCIHPEFEFDWSESRSPWSGVYKGHEALRRFWNDQQEAWFRFNIEIVEAIELDPERIVTATVVRGRGRGSGINLEATGAMLWTIRDGAILSGKLFQNKEEALEGAGASLQEAQD
jgi:ketosteroid isomerase-like protein